MTFPLWTSADYTLDWPTGLFTAELQALLFRPYRSWSGSQVQLLLREAFHSDRPASDFARLSDVEEWAGKDRPQSGKWLIDLIENAHQLRPHTPPSPYWAARRVQDSLAPPPPDPRRAFADLFSNLRASGYLDREFAEGCVLDDYAYQYLGIELNQRLRRPAGEPSLWPPDPTAWDTDTFYSLVEVVHDLVARPRDRIDCHAEGCGPHHADFDTDAGRRIYRSLVNRLLAEHHFELRLAEDGEDTGRLVELPTAGLSDLVDRALATPEPETATSVAHAVSLFRHRGATVENKRSAIVELARTLESRKTLLKATLFAKDESALFQIGNEFDLRHHDEKQHRNYDPAFLDWVYWWYLATVDLTNRLLARQSDDGSTP